MADCDQPEGCCDSCKGTGHANGEPCWDCRGTGHPHPTQYDRYFLSGVNRDDPS